jgi:hypothetical protein
MPIHSDTQIVTIETWVDFQFEDLNVSAILLIRECLNQIKMILENLKEYL